MKFRRLPALAAALFFIAVRPAFAQPPEFPFQDPALTPEARAADLVSRLTLDEKISALHAIAPDIPRLGVKKYYHGNEALHGVVRPGTFTVFPQAIALGATWDPDLIYKVATAISDEARGKNNHFKGEIADLYSGLLTFWSPTVNIARDPRWGRTPETYGEDPWLTGRIGISFVRGLQGNDPRYLKVVSTPKHFAANNTEYNRLEANAVISERTLREYYLAAFQALVTEGGAQSVMGAYNAVNGVPCNASKKLLTDVLRGEWGFDGYVVTDCGALETMTSRHHYTKDADEAAAAGINAGVDLECGGAMIYPNHLKAAVEKGLTTEEAVTRAAYRVLRGRFRLGFFDPWDQVPYNKIPFETVGSPEHGELALQAARESIVLLKNDRGGGRPLLPFDRSKIRSVFVTGPLADKAVFGDYSGSSVHPPVTPLAGIQNKAGSRVQVRHAAWIPTPAAGDYRVVEKDFLRPEGGGEAARGLKGEYYEKKGFAGAPPRERTDAAIDIDRNNHAPDPLVPHGDFSVRWTGRLTPEASGLHKLALYGDGGFRLWLDGELLIEKKREKAKSKLKVGEPFNLDKLPKAGPERVTASLSLEARRAHALRVEYEHVSGNAAFRMEWLYPTPERREMMAEHVRLARSADAVVAVMGIGTGDEREGQDRSTLDLPEDQDEYVKRLRAANPNLAVVLINGGPLSVNWIAANVPAVLEAWYPGERGGDAVAEVLFGDYNPAGRLPITAYKGVEQLPDFEDYELTNGPGRTYMHLKEKPLYPFGHGLSYASFTYKNARADKAKVRPGDEITVSVDVKNTGRRDGDEVVQLYARDLESSVPQPKKRLRGFQRVRLKRGETKTVEIPLKIENLSFWDEKSNGWTVEPGEFELQIGASSDDIRLKTIIEVLP